MRKLFIWLALVLGVVVAEGARADTVAASAMWTPGGAVTINDVMYAGCGGVYWGYSQYSAEVGNTRHLSYQCVDGSGNWSGSGTNTTTYGQNDHHADVVHSCGSGYTFQGYPAATCSNDCTSGSLVDAYIANNLSPSTVCQSGCESHIVQASNQCSVGGVQKICGTWKLTGVGCTGGVTASSGSGDFKCPVGQVPGTFNGNWICLPGSSADPIKVTTESTLTSGGDTTVKTVEETIQAGVTTTTTTTVVNGGAPVVTTETKSGVDPAEKSDVQKFCEQNPRASICVEGAWSGSCSSFTCSGDAVECAIAKEIHTRNCTLFETSTASSDLGNAAAAGTDSGTIDNPALLANRESIAMGSMISQTTFLAPSSLADVQFDVFDQQIILKLSTFNSLLTYMGYVVLTFSLLAAIRFVFK